MPDKDSLDATKTAAEAVRGLRVQIDNPHHRGRSGIWSRGYCVSTVWLNEKEILAYVTHQDHEDRGQLTLDLPKR